MAKRGGYLGGSTIIGPKTKWDENRSIALSREPTIPTLRGGMERDPMSKIEIEIRSVHEKREIRSIIKRVNLEKQRKILREKNKIFDPVYTEPENFIDMVEKMIAGQTPEEL